MNKTVYDTAVQAIAVAKYVCMRQGLCIDQAAQFCQDTQENWDVLQCEAKETWTQEGMAFFRSISAPEDGGGGWIVKIKRIRPNEHQEKGREV